MMKILDFHCHVYPANIARKAAKAVADFYEVVPGKDIPDLSGSLEQVLQAQEDAGITKTVVCSAATTPHQVRHINEFLAKTAADSHGRCLALGTLHPDSEDVAGDIAHLLSLGLKGVKLHPDMQRFSLNAPKAMALYEEAAGRLPFLLHTGDKRFPYSNPEQLTPVLEAFPETTFIGSHMGGYTVWEDAVRLLAGRYDNLWVDLSSTSFAVSWERFIELIRIYGVERVLFGTDFPMWLPSHEVEVFLSLPLTHKEKEKIAWENGAGLLHLSEPEMESEPQEKCERVLTFSR